jgi:hypothetical protein
MKPHRLILFGLALAALSLIMRGELNRVTHAANACTPPTTNGQYWAPNTKITVYIDPSFSAPQIASIKSSLSDWSGQSALTSNNITMTTTATDPGAMSQNTIRIVNDPSESTGDVATTLPPNITSNGQMVSVTIAFNANFPLNATTPAYNPNIPSAGSFLEKIFDHELGHVFGEEDNLVPTDPTTGQPNPCLQTPGANVMNGYCGTNDTGNGGVDPPSVTPCDNTAVAKAIATQGGRKTSGGGGSLPKCPAGGPAPDQDQGCNPSPIIIDVNGSGFQLTDAASGVRFDISGTGTPIQMGWTAEGAANAFLALPGTDGLVDNGKQLFGNFTPQPPSNNPNGFAALAVYDLPANGGNGDGIIDSHDAIYSVLRLWIDANHDGISQPEELHTLSSLGVVSISLNYTLSRRVDQYGNVFRYKAAVDPNDPDPSHVGRMAYDVFFVTAASSGTQ